jgi:hypothetical protein
VQYLRCHVHVTYLWLIPGIEYFAIGVALGTLPRRGCDAAKDMYEGRLKGLKGDELDASLTSIFESQRKRLSQYLKLPQGAEIILCPSGSDAEYIPVAMAKALHPNKTIANGVTQFNEIGAGTFRHMRRSWVPMKKRLYPDLMV